MQTMAKLAHPGHIAMSGAQQSMLRVLSSHQHKRKTWGESGKRGIQRDEEGAFRKVKQGHDRFLRQNRWIPPEGRKQLSASSDQRETSLSFLISLGSSPPERFLNCRDLKGRDFSIWHTLFFP